MPRDNKQNLPIIPHSPLLFGGKSLFPPSSAFFLRLLFVQVTAAQRISLQCALHSVQKYEARKVGLRLRDYINGRTATSRSHNATFFHKRCTGLG